LFKLGLLTFIKLKRLRMILLLLFLAIKQKNQIKYLCQALVKLLVHSRVIQILKKLIYKF